MLPDKELEVELDATSEAPLDAHPFQTDYAPSCSKEINQCR